MCGILTAFKPASCGGLEPQLNDSLKTLAHRGPDNTGYHADQDIFLGHTRLSILDTSSAANQPYRFENLMIVYNGEVFNYIELKDDLAAAGYQFSTGSDTEVIIKAFHHWGPDCFKKFNGMWALVIYDFIKKELVICRDRFGQKPLFISRIDEAFYIASELQSLAKVVQVKPNFAAIESFLKEGDFRVNGNSFFKDIFEFPKACFLRVDRNLQFELQQYWDYPTDISQAKTSPDQFHALLADAVSLRLRTDVDYSLLLSGGCDSTIVAGITRKLIGEGVKLVAFTYSSGDKDDEVQFSQEVARRLSIDLHVSSHESTPANYINRLRRLVKHLGRGHSSPAIVSVDCLYQSIQARGYKVALDGQGADELLAGYKHYHFHLLIDLMMRRRWKQAAALAKDMKNEGVLNILTLALRSSLPENLRKLMRAVYGYEGLFSRQNTNALQPHFLKCKPIYYKGTGTLNKYLFKQHNASLTNLLYYGDIVAMANSVENRSPFMDHRLVEMTFSSDFQLKVDMGRNKAVLRSHPVYQMFSNVLERKKIGFSSAIAKQTKEQMVRDLQNSQILKWPIFTNKTIRAFLYSDRAMSSKFERFLFRLFQVHLWEQEFLTSQK